MDWHIDELRPVVAVTAELAPDGFRVEGDNYFNDGDILMVVSTGHTALCIKSDEWVKTRPCNGGSILRHVEHVTHYTVHVHECGPTCEWVEDDSLDYDTLRPREGYFSHDYSLDRRPLALPHYRVRHARVGDEVLILGPAYAENSASDPSV